MIIRSIFIASATALALSASHPPQAACPASRPVVFTNARLLTMDSPQVRQVRALVVERGRIASIDPASLPTNACTVDAKGGILLPGLVDIHAHTDERELPLFLANGVTTVREMNGSPPMVALRDSIAAGKKFGPRLIVTSPLLVGTKLQFRHRLITSAEDAWAAAREAKAAGYEYLKIYDGLSRPMYDAFVAAGRELGLPLDGHIPKDVGIVRVIEAGQSIQHMDKIADRLTAHPIDTTTIVQVQPLFAGKRIWVTPTLASLRALDLARSAEYATRLAGPEMGYMDAGSLGWWKSLSSDVPSSRAVSQRYRFLVAILKELRKTDTRLLLGTDAGNPLMVPGFSVHDELDALTRDAGFTPYEALQLATKNVGEFLRDSTVGRIAPGARADLVLVDGNPLADISVLRKPVGVMVNGRWLDRAALDSLLVASKPK